MSIKNHLNFQFDGQVALVTGAAVGIGREIALAFAQSGARLILSDVLEEEGHHTAELARQQGVDVIYTHCDVSDESQVKDMVAQALNQFGRLDMACNNAGVEGVMGAAGETSNENWDRVMNINLRGAWLCMKYEIQAMLQQKTKGSIVNIASIAGLIGFPGLPAYVSSKHGLVGLTKNAALEYAAQGLRVNAICPGPIMTEMLKRIMATTPGLQESMTNSVPAKRIGECREVADSVLFLCSPYSGYTTGQALAIDGGWVAQ